MKRRAVAVLEKLLDLPPGDRVAAAEPAWGV
jgi:hypothetical protein